MKDNRAKYRIKFSKGDRLRFIGHLDLLNLFHRAIKRSKLPVSYSKGFNPHQETSFALPLSLGYYGNGEYIDVFMTRQVDGNEITAKLNSSMPSGIKILSTRHFEEGEKTAASLVAAAEYTVALPENSGIMENHLSSFLEQKEILIEKKTKKNTAQTNIREDILRLSHKAEGGFVKEINMLISAGSMRSIRADSVIQALYTFSSNIYNPYAISFAREELYKYEDGKYIALE